MRLSDQASTLDGQETKDIEAMIETIAQRDPRYRRIATELLKVGHDWGEVDYENGVPKLKNVLIPADSSKFEMPGEGTVWLALDDDKFKKMVISMQFLVRKMISGMGANRKETIQRIRVNSDGFGFVPNAKSTASSVKTLDYKFLALNLYEMLGSTEQISEEDRSSCVFLLRRTGTGMHTRTDMGLGLLVNWRVEYETFDIFDIDPESSCDDGERFPLRINSPKFGLVNVLNLKACLEKFYPVFKERYKLAKGFYPFF